MTNTQGQEQLYVLQAAAAHLGLSSCGDDARNLHKERNIIRLHGAKLANGLASSDASLSPSKVTWNRAVEVVGCQSPPPVQPL